MSTSTVPTPATEAETLGTLPPGHRACPDCGVAVPAEARAALLVTTTPARPAAALAAGGQLLTEDVPFVRCDACAALRDLAEAAIEANPAIGRRLGQETAIHLLDAALIALTGLAGQEAPSMGALDRAAVGALQRHLAAVGAGARFVTLVAPVATVPRDACASAPWAHLAADSPLRADARAGVAALLAERRRAADGAVTVLPPPAPDPDQSGGCLFCGVGQVEQSATAPTDAWTALTVATPTAIGAPASAEPVNGWLCTICRAAVDDAHVVGQAAMLDSLSTQLAREGRTTLIARLQGRDLAVCSWAGWVLRERRRRRPVPGANARPWAHVDPEA